MSLIRVVLSLTTSMNLELEQLDVKTTFLHGELHEEIYMDQPKGFEEEGKEHMVCKLKKGLYKLKQAPRQWIEIKQLKLLASPREATVFDRVFLRSMRLILIFQPFFLDRISSR
ncbi:hypothetical protein SLEP1_g59573 [Rubroshorea leprosula]|uniref:Reverse transcriptase Ty1/copia-type domain-containing protein n=1 Tax=Rubroshorea leprosula TaxID=152421 RepID=A0AAV5MSQ3_9ROSI|nr:hypothetical protein SLEP1_g59573 [Rubroshorea leprosula]